MVLISKLIPRLQLTFECIHLGPRIMYIRTRLWLSSILQYVGPLAVEPDAISYQTTPSQRLQSHGFEYARGGRGQNIALEHCRLQNKTKYSLLFRILLKTESAKAVTIPSRRVVFV